MRESFDAQCKESLEVLLDDVGTVVRGLEVAAASQRFDLWFTPDPAHHDERLRRGLLGVLVDDPDGCALEPFRSTPGVAAVDDCVRKLAVHRHHLAAAAERRQPSSRAARPWVIVLSPGDPLSAREEYGLAAPMSPGVYRTARGTGLVLVVLSALPTTRETLALRLLARGPTFLQALAELRALPHEEWEHRLVDVLLRWRREARVPSHTETNEEDEIMGALAELQAWRKQCDAELRDEGRKEGRREGRKEGTFAVLARQCERKLRRPLRDAERDTLHARLAAQGDALGDVVVDLDASALEAWFATPDAH